MLVSVVAEITLIYETCWSLIKAGLAYPPPRYAAGLRARVVRVASWGWRSAKGHVCCPRTSVRTARLAVLHSAVHPLLVRYERFEDIHKPSLSLAAL